MSYSLEVMDSEYNRPRINQLPSLGQGSPEVPEEKSETLLPFQPQRSLLPPPPSIVVQPPEAIIIVNPDAGDSIKSGNFGKLVRRASQKYEQEARINQAVIYKLYEKKPFSADSSFERSEDWHKFNF